MMDDNQDRDMMDVGSDDKQKPERPMFTPKIGADFMRNFLKPRATEEIAAEEPAADAAGPAPTKSAEEIEAAVIAELKEIFDPEIPVNIYELGLIYGVEVDAELHVHVTMTLTTPHCPVAETMPGEVEERCREAAGQDVTVNLVWDPPWDMSRMSDEARLELGLL